MKKKWYRNSMVKTVAAAVGIASLTAAAAGGTAAAGIMSMGVQPFDSKNYLESRSFENSMYHNTYEVMHALSKKEFLNADKGDGVIDIGEILEKKELTYTDTTGLAYKIEDLKEWASMEDWNRTTDDILICVKPDGSLEYMYYEDFEKKVQDKELNFLIDSGSYSDYDDNVEYATDVQALQPESSDFKTADEASTQGILACLENHDYYSGEYYGEERYYSDSNIGILNSGALGVVDSEGEMVYKNVLNEESNNQIAEAFAPVGADSILDVVNKEPAWAGKLDNAFMALNDTLYQVTESRTSQNMLDNYYTEGKGNLSYIVVRDPGKAKENIESNVDTKDYEKTIKDLEAGEDPYVVLYSEPGSDKTNMELAGEKNSSSMQHLAEDLTGAVGLSTWRHMVENVAFDDEDVDYVCAVWVDKNLPVQDLMAEDSQNFKKYSTWLTPSMTVFAAGVILFLICFVILTAGAGRNNSEEGVQLNFFDRWYTEVGACAVAGLWVVPVAGLFALGINIDSMDKLKYLVYLAAALGLWTAVMFFAGWLSLVRRIKAGTFWKNSLVRKLWRLLVKICRKIFRLCRNAIEFFSENTASRIKMALIFTGFCFLQFLLCAITFSGGAAAIILLGAIDLLGLIYYLKKARGRELILDGLKRITEGELQYKIPLDKLTGEQKRMADLINRIGQGLDAAVENSLKNERMKTELITNVSHDIKTPLTSIINYVDLLKRENPQDPKIQGYLNILEEKSQRLKTLTEDVVEASKASTGNISLEMADLNFVELVQQVIGEFEERFQERNLSIMVHFDQEEAIICADGRRLWRVLENVFGNVSKYAMENTRVYAEIKVNRKKVFFSLKNISAQPLNISADELTERFIRGDVSRNTEGSGLGLSIAKSLTELQGGEFKLYLDGDLFKVTIVFAVKEKNTEEPENK